MDGTFRWTFEALYWCRDLRISRTWPERYLGANIVSYESENILDTTPTNPGVLATPNSLDL